MRIGSSVCWQLFLRSRGEEQQGGRDVLACTEVYTDAEVPSFTSFHSFFSALDPGCAGHGQGTAWSAEVLAPSGTSEKSSSMGKHQSGGGPKAGKSPAAAGGGCSSSHAGDAPLGTKGRARLPDVQPHLSCQHFPGFPLDVIQHLLPQPAQDNGSLGSLDAAFLQPCSFSCWVGLIEMRCAACCWHCHPLQVVRIWGMVASIQWHPV